MDPDSKKRARRETNPNPGYRKGDSHSGGGGGSGGGGKGRRPQFGWEKGDVARDPDLHGAQAIRKKPKRRVKRAKRAA